jgi:hypothetical protein
VSCFETQRKQENIWGLVGDDGLDPPTFSV